VVECFPLAALPSLDGAEHGKEFVQLHLRALHVVEAIAREGRRLVCHLRQPWQHGVRGNRKDAGHRPNPQAFGHRSHRPHQHLGRDPLAM